MDRRFLEYKPDAGYLHHWLVAGPQLFAIDKQGAPAFERGQIMTRYWRADNEINEPPTELAKFTLTSPGGEAQEFAWRYFSCEADHLLDLADEYPQRHYVRSWAYTEIVSPVAQKAHLTVHLFGPVQIWLNNQPILQKKGFHRHLSAGMTTEVQLEQGANALLLRLEQFVDGPTPYAAGLHLVGLSQDSFKVQLPTRVADPKKHQSIERLARRAYIEGDLYAGAETFNIKWPRTIQAERRLMVRLQTPTGFVSHQMEPVVKAGFERRMFESASGSKDGSYKIRIMAQFDDFILGFRVHHDLDVNVLHSDYAATPQGELTDRAIEMAQHAAWWTDGLYSEIASMFLGMWKQVNVGRIRRIMDTVLAGGADADYLMIGFLLIAYRYRQIESFPPALVEPLEECILGFDYGDGNVPPKEAIEEDRAILSHVCNLLAGQLYPKGRFAHSGEMGALRRQRGEEGILAWLARKAAGGFAAWDSAETFEAMVLALVAVVDHAESEDLSESAAAIIDKILTSLAINSYQGIFGSTHGATKAASITDGRAESTSGMSRFLWGVGCWNQYMAACIALAGSEKYGPPTLLQMIALDKEQEVWARERHNTLWRGAEGEASIAGEVDKVTYRTPDYMLCSAQDHHAGETGLNEHIWQATLSPSAVVFVNHPVCLSQHDSYRPNFWCGNGRLPRVAQWRDVLVALHRLPDDDWLGYTHAHFPIAAFDETIFRGGWAFARKDDGYLALTASGGIKQIKDGPGALRELRSSTAQTVWLCHMGRKTQDGSFIAFQKAILALPISFNGTAKAAPGDFGVSLTTLRGDSVSFGWTGAFTVNSDEQPLKGYKHYDSPYVVCELGASEMEVRYEEWLLQLNFAAEEE